MASPFSWPVLVPYALRDPAPVNLGVSDCFQPIDAITSKLCLFKKFTHMHSSELQSLRDEVDDIDAKIIELLASRFLVTKKIGNLKKLRALNAIDPEREAAQEARFRDLAQRSGLNADLVLGIFRSIIDEVVSNHASA